MSVLIKQERCRKRQLQKLQRQMQGIRNEMEFVEILVQFWPWPNMALKIERMEQRLKMLDQQYRHFASLGSTG
jgi:hypothetical protein